MCGLFGIYSKNEIVLEDLKSLARSAQQRGRDSSGLLFVKDNSYHIERADFGSSKLVRQTRLQNTPLVVGHSRLVTNGMSDNQPVYRDDIAVFHNGIVVNDDEIWGDLQSKRLQNVDSEAIAGIAADHLQAERPIEDLAAAIIGRTLGVVACIMILPRLGKLLIFSNNGSLYVGKNDDCLCFASEKFSLTEIGCSMIEQVFEQRTYDVPATHDIVDCRDHAGVRKNLVPALSLNKELEKELEYPKPNFRRCTKCVLPETMPFIKFDDAGVCNYCTNYIQRNKPKPKEQLFELLEKYRKTDNSTECVVPFSGGRDSCYALHLIVNEIKMKPVTYTYDWGMVTDLGRRNISRMCGELGVENIIVAANIEKKRLNIKKNLTAWLKSPHLGMVSILTAGDKHFFHHVETVKTQTNTSLNLWGVNPLEVTHFKSGFLGVPPDFAEEKVYTSGFAKQLHYQRLRFSAMLKSLGYFNSSLFDTLSGEYYRSFHKKSDYFHVFDYWTWDENVVNRSLESYGWEKAIDTSTTWRIGDGTAAFYNYIYQTVAGFTEHDTFRSNQIREGQISRQQALNLIEEENQPRLPNIKWYLDAIDMEFVSTIRTINNIHKLYEIGRE